ncbi:hypothetical protein EMIT0158MI4_50315 [Burkholderia ambifaria]
MVSCIEDNVPTLVSGSSQNFGLSDIVCVAVSGPQTWATSPARFLVFGVHPSARSSSGSERTKFLAVKSIHHRDQGNQSACQYTSSGLIGDPEPFPDSCPRRFFPGIELVNSVRNYFYGIVTQSQNLLPKFRIGHVFTDWWAVDCQ